MPEGERRMVPTAWTSLAPEDPYQLLGDRPLLRLEALQELAEWLCQRGEAERS